MSWSAPSLTVSSATVESDVAALTLPANMVDPSPQVVEQFDAAKGAVASLVQSGAVGEGKFIVNLSGHANPDHKPAQGWANDCIYVYISQS